MRLSPCRRFLNRNVSLSIASVFKHESCKMRQEVPQNILLKQRCCTAQHQAYLSASEAVPFLVWLWRLDLSDFLECLWNEMLKKHKIYDESRYSYLVILYNDKKQLTWKMATILPKWFCQSVLS